MDSWVIFFPFKKAPNFTGSKQKEEQRVGFSVDFPLSIREQLNVKMSAWQDATSAFGLE